MIHSIHMSHVGGSVSMAYNEKAALEQYNGMVRLENLYLRRRYFRKIVPIVLTIAFSVIGYYACQPNFIGEKTTFIAVSVITVIILWGFYPFQTGWLHGSTLYYKIDGSTDAQGNHRCIRCGNRGIWRSGQYKSNDVHCYCSQCRFSLWKERK